MKIIIIGCGQVGATLTEQLSGEKHDITVIDTNASVVSKLGDTYDVMGMCGNGVSIQTLTDAGVADSDMVIAVTESDEINLLCCLMAKKVGHCHTVARVRGPIYSGETDFIKAQMGIDLIINPEKETALEIAQLIRYPSAEKIDSFAKGMVQLVKIKITEDSPLNGIRLRSITQKTGCEMLVCAVERGDEVIIPDGHTAMYAGDTISFIVPDSRVGDTLSKLGLKHKPVKNVMIVGGDTIAVYLCRLLCESGVNTKIIEKDMARCEHLDTILPDITVIQGDGTDKQQLLDEDIRSADAFVANTNIDEENLFLSVFAKKVSDAKLVSKVNRLAFDDIITGLDIGSVIYPKYLTADYIVQYVRALENSAGNNVSTLYRLLNNKVEALEFSVHEDSPAVNKPIMQLNLKSNLLICCICRGNEVIIPGGYDSIHVGDSVIVVTLDGGLNDIRDILKED